MLVTNKYDENINTDYLIKFPSMCFQSMHHPKYAEFDKNSEYLVLSFNKFLCDYILYTSIIRHRNAHLKMSSLWRINRKSPTIKSLTILNLK